MLIKEALEKTIQFFKEKKLDTPRLDSELLFAHALNLSRMDLYLKYDRPLTEAELQACRDLVRRRIAGEPVAYIIEEKGFFGHLFKVRKGVLIPRPETELMVEFVLDEIKKQNLSEVRILDLGAGSGCIGFSIKLSIPEIELVSIERSAEAFSVLSENAKIFNFEENIKLIQNDVLSVDTASLGTFDFILANPPYIDITDELVEINVKKYEPHEALYSADRGLADLKSWSKHYLKNLKENGVMIFEIGFSQGEEAAQIFEQTNGLSAVGLKKDLAGNDRFIIGKANTK